MVAYTFILSSRFHPSLTGLAVHAREECIAMAEIKQSLQVDLVLSDVAATNEPRLVQSVCSHFAYSNAAMWLKCVQHPKNAIFTHNFAMSTTPGYKLYKTNKIIDAQLTL